MSAKASGTDAGRNTNNDERGYSAAQEAAVLRIRKCAASAFYDILDLESVRATASETDIKKAYRKQSLLTHPDKNGHPSADEAFKKVSHAFGVLGDRDKRAQYDRSGVDPDNRFASQQAANDAAWARARGFGGGGGGGGGMRQGMGGMFADEMSPEEMFQRFFGGADFGGFGGFNQGGFVFNMGGGPGVRVHQFGGARPRGRPRNPTDPTQQQDQDQQQQQPNLISTLITLLPVILLFLMPLLSNLFSSALNGPAPPRMAFDTPSPPHTHPRVTEQHGVRYFVDPRDVAGYDAGAFARLDRQAEQTLVRHLERACNKEMAVQEHLREEARGWLGIDRVKMARADAYGKPSCDRLRKMGFLS